MDQPERQSGDLMTMLEGETERAKMEVETKTRECNTYQEALRKQKAKYEDLKLAKQRGERLRVAEEELEKITHLYKHEQLLRKKYHNTIQDMKGAVRVYCRWRPSLPSEANDAVVLQKRDEFSVQLTRERNGVKEARSFNF